VTTVRIVSATRELAAELAPHVRPDEVAEVLAMDGATPLEALLAGLELSDPVRAALFDGEVAAIWGVVPGGKSVLRGRVGVAWMLTSAAVERHPKAFWRGCRAELPKLFERYDTLANAIDARHRKALGWACRLGFQLGQPAPMGIAALPFARFIVRKEDLRV
jgi:hypothetical protein